jgi:hypothetical protein
MNMAQNKPLGTKENTHNKRRQKLESALKENIKKRKEQARARKIEDQPKKGAE